MLKKTPILIVFVLVGCAGTGAVAPVQLSQDVAAIDSSLTATGAAPTVAEYETARGSFVSALENSLRSAESRAGSSAVKVRSAIAGVGSILGVGGLVASFVVKNEDTQSAIAQAAGGVAAVTGLVGLIPMGGGVEESRAVASYLNSELPYFADRWPETVPEPLKPGDWIKFVEDCRRIESNVNALRGAE